MDTFFQFIQQSSFYEFATLLALASVAGLFAHFFRQPLLIAFILIGVLAGPSAFDFMHSSKELELLSKLGISVLLFIVGLKLDLKLIKSLGLTALFTGVLQMLGTFGAAYFLSTALGIEEKSAFFIGIATAFSSTIIIVKILSDKKEIDSMHGKIALGVLIVQDFAVVFAMMVLSTIASIQQTLDLENMASLSIFFDEFITMGINAGILVAIIAIFMRFAALKLVSKMASSAELLLCFALAWAFLLSAICDYIGLSKELGGLMAGISLASTPYREAIVSKLASIRDFLLLFFFITLGASLDFSVVGGQNELIIAVILAVFVLVFKPLIVFLLAMIQGYKPRTAFLSGVSLGQVSEFSFIFLAMAVSLKLAEPQILGMVTLVGMITIAVSTYGMSMSNQLYNVFEPFLVRFDKKADLEEEGYVQDHKRKSYDIILFGMGRYGKEMVERFKGAKKKLLIVDFNPEVVKEYRADGYDIIYGDASDPDFYHFLPLNKTKWVVSAMPPHNRTLSHDDPRMIMLKALKASKFKGKIALASHSEIGQERFEEEGVHVIFKPFKDAAERAVEKLLEINNDKK